MKDGGISTWTDSDTCVSDSESTRCLWSPQEVCRRIYQGKEDTQHSLHCGGYFHKYVREAFIQKCMLEGSFRYPLARQGVFATGGPDCLAHTRQKVINIVGLTALRLAFFMGYE